MKFNESTSFIIQNSSISSIPIHSIYSSIHTDAGPVRQGRDPENLGKWALPYWLFAESSFGFDYLMGAGYFQSWETIPSILQLAKCSPLLFMDDLYFGLLASKLKLIRIDDPRFFKEQFKVPSLIENGYLMRDGKIILLQEWALIPDLTPSQIESVWNLIMSKRAVILANKNYSHRETNHSSFPSTMKKKTTQFTKKTTQFTKKTTVSGLFVLNTVRAAGKNKVQSASKNNTNY